MCHIFRYRNSDKPSLNSSHFFSSVGFKVALFFLLVFVAIVAYWPVLHNALVCDDYYNVGLDRVPLLTDPNSADSSLPILQWCFKALEPFFLRPVVLFVWLILSHLFSLNPWPYHIVSVFLHAGNAWLIFWLLNRLKASTVTAVIPALLFLLTPIAPEAVTWSSGYFDLFSLFFILLSLCLYTVFLEQGKRKFYAFSIAAMALALFSKENALIFIFAIPVLEILFGNLFAGSDSRDSNQRKRRLKQAAVRVVPFIVIMLGYLTIRYAVLGTLLNNDYFNSARPSLGPQVTIKTFLSPFSITYFSLVTIRIIYLYMLVLSTIALLLVLVNWHRMALKTRRLWIFFLVLFLLSLMPIYWFLFHGLRNDLFNSRYLYTPTAFYLALIAISLIEFARNIKYLVWINIITLLLLLPCYFYGLHKNNFDWEVRSNNDSHLLSEIRTLLPYPPDEAKIYLIEEEGTANNALYWCDPMLQPGIKSSYGRYDIHVLQLSSGSYRAGYPETGDGYLFIFNSKTEGLVLEHAPLQ